MPLQEVDWDKFEFRCHYFGELMTPVRGKSNSKKYYEALDLYNKKYEKYSTMPERTEIQKNSKDNFLTSLMNLSENVDFLKTIKDVPVLSDTCIKRLNQIYTEATTGRRKKIQSIFIEKGLMTEEDSITNYSMIYGKMYRKNKERVSNGWVTGEIDIDVPEEDLVVDTKSSFDIFSFDDTVGAAINGMKRLYEWQGVCYMWLKNRGNFRLAYSLNNTPEQLIEKMEKSLKYNFLGSEEEYKEACLELRFNHTFDDLPLERRMRVYDIKRDDSKIELAKTMIPHFRNYLKNYGKGKLEDNE